MYVIHYHWCLFLLLGTGIKGSALRGIDSTGIYYLKLNYFLLQIQILALYFKVLTVN